MRTGPAPHEPQRSSPLIRETCPSGEDIFHQCGHRDRPCPPVLSERGAPGPAAGPHARRSGSVDVLLTVPIRTVVSRLLGYAVRAGAIDTNPARQVGQIEGDRKPVRALDQAERIDLLDKLDADPVAVRHDLPGLVRFMLGTGCRIGEAIAVQDEAIDWAEHTVSIEANLVRVKSEGLRRHEGKTFAAQRVLPIPRFVMSRLIERRPSDVEPNSMIFPNTNGHDLDRASWRDPHNTGGRLREALHRAGYDWINSHVFRKTVATVLDEARLTARAIAGHIGHARPSITQDVYMDKRSGSREAADVLDEAYRSE